MAKANDKTPMIVGGIALAAVAAFVLTKKKDSQPTFDPGQVAPEPTPVVNVPVTQPVAISLNKNLLLKNGSKGSEVKELQKLLGISADGVFGAQTEAALYAKKGVKQITLNEYANVAGVNQNPLKVGDRVMANKNGVKTTIANLAANQTYFDTGATYKAYGYGTEIGKIVAISTPTKSRYVVEVQVNTALKTKVWVNAADVIKL
ncbi:peptidoglycan-binding domain-containing protein [Flavobacterium sp.]|uniref:peptidoglycan-binding domain-containing protein n=1 Tax=Flavobacterium sp. TaxID=239 RepID=UPI004034E2DB